MQVSSMRVVRVCLPTLTWEKTIPPPDTQVTTPPVAYLCVHVSPVAYSTLCSVCVYCACTAYCTMQGTVGKRQMLLLVSLLAHLTLNISMVHMMCITSHHVVYYTVLRMCYGVSCTWGD